LDSPSSLHLPHGSLRFPVFLPDGTLGVVRSVDADDLKSVGVQGMVMNTFHLMQKPGSSTIHALGGLHRMSAPNKAPFLTVVSPSGQRVQGVNIDLPPRRRYNCR
jgi:queuine tRNA-ribosyltransferase